MLEPSLIFHTVVSFMTNTDVQHYSGDQHLSNFSQLFFCIANFFLSASIGFCSLTAIIRALRGDKHVGNFFIDMWRVVMYTFLPVAFLVSFIFLQQGSPMTFKSTEQVATLEPGAMGTTDSGEAKQQTIVVGPLAVFMPMKQLGTNGGGFYGMNNTHPFESPTALTNFVSCVAMMLFPFALVLMYGRMLRRLRHAWVIFWVMMAMMIGTVVWTVYYDTLQPNPGLTAHRVAESYQVADANAPGRHPYGGAAGRRRAAGRPAPGQSGRQGNALWHLRRRHLRRVDGRRDRRRGELRARQSQSAGGAGAVRRHVAQRDLRRQRRRHDQHADLLDRRRLHRRPDGRAYARVPGQEDRGARDEAGDDRVARPSDHDPRADRSVFGDGVGDEGRRATPARTASRRFVYQFASSSANNGSAFDGLGDVLWIQCQSDARRRWPYRGTSPAGW